LKKSHTLTLFAFAFAATFSTPAFAAEDRDQPTNEKKKTEEAEHFRIGALGGVGLPRPLAIEGLVRLEGLVAVGAEYSLMPNLTIAGVDTSFWAVAGDVRVFPFKGAFFIGARVGRQHASGKTTLTGNIGGTQLSATESVGVDTTFVNPRIGFLWRFEPGIALGMDAGVQLPVASSTESTLPTTVAQSEQVTNAVNLVGKSPLPTVDLLRVGFLF